MKKIRKSFELAIQKSNYFSLLFEKFWIVSPNVDSVFLLVSYGIYEKSHGALFVVWMFFVEIKKYLAMQELSQAIVPKVYSYGFLK